MYDNPAMAGQIEAEMDAQIGEDIFVATETWNAIADLMPFIGSKVSAELNNRSNICVLLVPRIANDLYATIQLCRTGYPRQAASVACSGWELGWVMQYVLLLEDEEAQKWFLHTDRKTSFHKDLRSTIDKVAKLGYPQLKPKKRIAFCDEQYEIYREFSMIRHGNPQAFFVELVRYGATQPILGPRTNFDAIRSSKVILRHLLMNTIASMLAWLIPHMNDPDSAKPVDDFRCLLVALRALPAIAPEQNYGDEPLPRL